VRISQKKNRIELKNRRRLPGESLTDLHIDIRRLTALAYPDTDHKTRELISCDYFIDALANPELGLKIRERQPKELDAALHIALQLEVWTQDIARLSQLMEQTSVETNMVREISQLHKGGRSMNDLKLEIDAQHKLIAEQNKLVASCQQMLETMNVYIQSIVSGDTGSRTGQRPHALVSCSQCSQLGHVASYCPIVVRQNKEVMTDSEYDCSGPASTSGLQAANSLIQHVRPINDKQVKTCIQVRYRAYKLITLLDTGSGGPMQMASRNPRHCAYKTGEWRRP